MKVLLLSGYGAQSHEYWAATLQRNFSDIQWTYLALPGRHFSWRVRGSSFAFFTHHRGALSQHYDLVIATSMVDVASLKGFCPQLAQCPWYLYFHENQFAYPDQRDPKQLVDIQLTTIYSALASDRVFFNSKYNQDTFFSGAKKLLKRLPDYNDSAILDEVLARAQVLPVPIDAPLAEISPKNAGDILWNHRWEYDKGPDRLLAFAEKLVAADMPCRIHIVGQRFRRVPSEIEEAARVLDAAGKLGEYGYLERSVYRELLATCEYVLSTSLHDFQGLSILEAVALGAKPLVPSRLVYPEWFGSLCYNSDENIETEAQNILDTIVSSNKRASVDFFYSSELINAYKNDFLHVSS